MDKTLREFLKALYIWYKKNPMGFVNIESYVKGLKDNSVKSILEFGRMIKEKGFNIGRSFYEEDPKSINAAKKLIKSKKIILPKDIVVAKTETSPAKTVAIDKIPDNYVGFDIGEQTIEHFKKELKKAKTIVWNGPLGKTEISRFTKSTKEIAKIVGSVQHDSSDAVNAIEQGQREVENGVAVAQKAGEALQKIGQSAQNSSRVAAEIAVLVREQTTASTRVAESIQDVTNMINEITRATQEQEKNSSQLFIVVEKMQTLAAQVMRATQEQQQSTLHVTDFMEDVISLVNENTPIVKQLAQSANELAAQSDLLKKQVERFVLPERD